MKRVVITGLGALTPIGNNLKEYHDGLMNGRSGAVEITKFDATHFKTRFACELKGFDPNDHFDRREAKRMDAFTQYAMVTARQAIEDSQIDLETIDPTQVGVIWGSGIGGLRSLEEQIEIQRPDKPRYNPFMIPKMIADIAPGLISIEFGFRGINYGTISACSSSSHAIINATDYIRLGRSKMILCGGSEAAVTKAGIGGFSSMKALSERNDSPKTASRPFDANRDGFVLGEGAGALFLEEYEHAKERGAPIYAEVVGVGMTADAYHMTAPHPEGLGASEVMNKALKDAGFDGSEVDYINVHGTSTPLGDVAEIAAIEKVFGEKAYDLNISSTKSMTGHLLGAAGAIESIAGIIAMRNNFIPPTINNEDRDEKIDNRLNLTLNNSQERNVNVVLNNTFGFGGHNTSIIFRQM